MIGWLLEPFERVALDTVGLWYVVTTVLGFGVVYIFENIIGVDMDSQIPEHWSFGKTLFATVVFAPIVEEITARILPHYLGVGFWGMLVLTAFWAIMHGRHALTALLHGVVLLKLVFGGFYVEAIALHAFHNLWATLYMFRYSR